MSTTYLEVTELAGDGITAEQLKRLCNRYYWAEEFCKGKDVLEVACGSGPGLGYLSTISKSLVAGDISPEILKIARNHYKDSIDIRQFDACLMPFADAFFDVIIIFEAIYYLPEIEKFINECKRVLRRGGTLLIATANKDLYDFTPSPYSNAYYGVVELSKLLERHGFESTFYGGTSTKDLSHKQKVIRPLKKIASKMKLIPKTMHGKKWLKKIIFGQLIPMPTEINASTTVYESCIAIKSGKADTTHKVIFCAAHLKN